MDTVQRRTAYYVSVLAAVMVGYAVAYHYGMGAFEDESVRFLHSLQVVVETFTTTGFGSDAPWESTAMNLLVVVMDLTGVALIFLALPVLVFPLMEEVLATTVPSTAEGSLSDHVVVCTYTSRGETLTAELESRDVEYVIVEPDRERATDLYESGRPVIHAEPDSVDGLEAARLPEARALVADVSDQVDASIVLTAGEVAEDVRVVSVVDEPDRAPYHELAGADAVLSPRSLLGERLAHEVATAVTAELADAIEIGEDFEVAEIPIHRGSDLVGKTLAGSDLRERTGVNVVGAWFRGEFRSPPPPDATLDSGTVLLVTGRESQLERLRETTLSGVRRRSRGETIVVGYGEVGRTIVAALDDADLPATVVDRQDVPGVDIVGDATDPEVLEEAGVGVARSIVLAIPDDTATEFATLVVRDLNGSIEVVARAEGSEAARKMYRAGADYVLSLGTVSGRMIASEVLESEEVVAPDTQVEVVRTRAPGLVGRTLGEARVRSRTGCTVVAVERDEEVLTDVGPEFRVRAGDELVVVGTDEGTNGFTDRFG